MKGRALDDNVQVMLRYANGARGLLWASQVAPGNENDLRLRVYGTKGGLDWSRSNPNQLLWSPFGQPTRIVTRGARRGRRGGARVAASRPAIPRATSKASPPSTPRSRTRSAPRARARSRPKGVLFPTVEDGVKGVAFIEAAVKSSKANAKWVKL